MSLTGPAIEPTQMEATNVPIPLRGSIDAIFFYGVPMALKRDVSGDMPGDGF
jgi:hypothetical protein